MHRESALLRDHNLALFLRGYIAMGVALSYTHFPSFDVTFWLPAAMAVRIQAFSSKFRSGLINPAHPNDNSFTQHGCMIQMHRSRRTAQ
jgi:hypothetical protein